MSSGPKGLVPAAGECLVHVGDVAAIHVHVRIAEGTVWQSQELMYELYAKDVRTINEHLQLKSEQVEFDPEATIRKSRIVRPRRNHSVPNLIDQMTAIIAGGSPTENHAR